MPIDLSNSRTRNTTLCIRSYTAISDAARTYVEANFGGYQDTFAQRFHTFWGNRDRDEGWGTSFTQPNADYSLVTSDSIRYNHRARAIPGDEEEAHHVLYLWKAGSFTVYTTDGNSVSVRSPYGEHTNKWFSGRDQDNATGCLPPLMSEALSSTATSLTHGYVNHRESPYRRTERYGEFKNCTVCIDQNAVFSVLDPSVKEHYLSIAGTGRVPAIKVDNLFRGGNGTAVAEKVMAKPRSIAKGNYIFAYRNVFSVLNQDTCEYEDQEFLCLGMFGDLEKIIKYKRSRSFLPTLADSLVEEDGFRFFRPEEYQTRLQDTYGRYTQYWDGITRIFKDKLPTDANTWDLAKIDQDKRLAAEHLTYLHRINELNNNAEVREFKKITTARKEISEKLVTAKTTRDQSTRDISSFKNSIEDLERRIRSYEETLVTTEKTLKKSETEVSAYDQALKSTDEEYSDKKTTYKGYLETLDAEITSGASPDTETWISNLENTGIIVTDIQYETSNGVHESIKDKPELALTAKLTMGAEAPEPTGQRARASVAYPRLFRVDFVTTKPVVIRVDYGDKGDACKKIVGGPYSVRLTRHGLDIRLASSSSVFGLNEANNAWIHPHTPQIYASSASFADYKREITKWVTGCLGEAAPGIYKAFDNNEPRTALWAAMTWITSANSVDAWGKNWKFFPRLEEVNLEGTGVYNNEEVEPAIEELVTSDEGIETLVEQAAAAILPTSVIADLETVEIVEEQETISQATPIADLETVPETEELHEVVQRGDAQAWAQLPEDAAAEELDRNAPDEVDMMQHEAAPGTADPLIEVPNQICTSCNTTLGQTQCTLVSPLATIELPYCTFCRCYFNTANFWQAEALHTVRRTLISQYSTGDPMAENFFDHQDGDLDSVVEAGCACESCTAYTIMSELPSYSWMQVERTVLLPEERLRPRLRAAGYEGYVPFADLPS